MTFRSLLACSLLLTACGGPTEPTDSVASVTVTPDQATLAVGQVARLSATPLDRDGNPVVKPVTWSSSAADVASVNSNGEVTGVSEGSASITATSETASASASVTVLPAPVATVEVQPADTVLLPGETAQLAATVRSEQGVVLTDRTVDWVSGNVAVATVDQDGLVTAVTPGDATIFATSEGKSGGATIEVEDPNAAKITSVTPDTLIEGMAATIVGTGFSPVAAENTVTIDGIRATVTAATETSLDIGEVPASDCKPRRTVSVSVTVAGSTTSATHPVRPAAFFDLAVGEQVVLQDPTAYCLQFDADVSIEEYVIGLQSTAETPSSVTPARLIGELASGSQPAPLAGRPRVQATPGRVLTAPEIDPRLRWRANEALFLHEAIEEMRALVDAGLSTAADRGPAAASIPGDVTVGTAVTVKYPDRSNNNTCRDFVSIVGVVRAVGTRGIFVSDNNNPSGGFTDAEYQTLSDRFDTDIYDNLTTYFGDPADQDGNERIVVTVSKEVNEDSIGGIVPVADLFPLSTCPASNEGEYFFMLAPDPNNQFSNGGLTRAQALSFASELMGHEIVHIIHLSRRFANDLDFWTSWMAEGQATLAEEVLGHALTPGRSPGQNYGWDVVDNVPMTADRAWYRGAFIDLFYYYGWSGEESSPKIGNAPEACTWLDTPRGENAGVCANRGSLVYGVTWSFLRWISDQFGSQFAGGESGLHTAWIDEPRSGFRSLEEVIGEPIETLLAQWAAALYVDDRFPVLNDRLEITSYDLLDIEEAVVEEARLDPRARSFGGFNDLVRVRAGSTAYFLVTGGDRGAIAIRARSDADKLLDPVMQVWVVRVR